MRRLLIFLKHPAPGRVKTRLAQAVGPQAAANIYRACTELTLQRLQAFRQETLIYVDPPNAVPSIRAGMGCGWTVLPQRGHTLGARLASATQQAFRLGARRVVVIGTDSPWLTPAHINAAFTALKQTDVVLGPTEDGGYYLVGISCDLPKLFDGIPWSTPQVFQHTQAKVRALGLRLSTVSPGYDLDYVEDVQRFVADERRSQSTPPAVDRIVQCMNGGSHA